MIHNEGSWDPPVLHTTTEQRNQRLEQLSLALDRIEADKQLMIDNNDEVEIIDNLARGSLLRVETAVQRGDWEAAQQAADEAERGVEVAEEKARGVEESWQRILAVGVELFGSGMEHWIEDAYAVEEEEEGPP